MEVFQIMLGMHCKSCSGCARKCTRVAHNNKSCRTHHCAGEDHTGHEEDNDATAHESACASASGFYSSVQPLSAGMLHTYIYQSDNAKQGPGCGAHLARPLLRTAQPIKVTPTRDEKKAIGANTCEIWSRDNVRVVAVTALAVKWRRTDTLYEHSRGTHIRDSGARMQF